MSRSNWRIAIDCEPITDTHQLTTHEFQLNVRFGTRTTSTSAPRRRRVPTPAQSGTGVERQRSADDYGADKIKVLEGLEAVRKRPAMYIGSTGAPGLHHLVYEIVDNSIDEALAGYCDQVNVTIHIDNSVTVVDNGRGIPVDMHESGKSAAEVVLTVLHAGGKFDNDSYKVSGGLHGVGVSVVNALSETLELEIWRNGQVYQQTYERGAPTGRSRGHRHDQEARHEDHVQARRADLRDRPSTASTRWRSACASWRSSTAASPSRIDDERDGKAHKFLYEGGIVSFVEYLNKNKAAVNDKPIYMHGEQGRHRRRDRAAVERRLRRDDLLVRQQHQHARRRHAPLRASARR